MREALESLALRDGFHDRMRNTYNMSPSTCPHCLAKHALAALCEAEPLEKDEELVVDLAREWVDPKISTITFAATVEHDIRTLLAPLDAKLRGAP